MRSNATTTSQVQYEEDVDYNDIQSLRAYAARTQQYHSMEEHGEEESQTQYDNPQDADWDNDMNS